MLNIIEEKDLIYDIKDYDVILVGTNIKNALGNGFQHKIARNFPFVRKSNEETRYDDPSKLGTVRIVQDGTPEFPIFALCYITRGRYRPDKNPDMVDYDALKKCLQLVAKNFPDKKIAMTFMGVSEYEGGGDPDKIWEIIEETMSDCKSVTVYDYDQENYRYEDNTKYGELRKKIENKEVTTKEYEELMKKYIWERKVGIYTPMPEGSLKEVKKAAMEEVKRRKEELHT